MVGQKEGERFETQTGDKSESKLVDDGCIKILIKQDDDYMQEDYIGSNPVNRKKYEGSSVGRAFNLKTIKAD